MGSNKDSTSANFGDIEDLIHNFLIIILEHSMRQKDGWKVNFLLFYTHFGLPLSFSLSLSLSLSHTHTHTHLHLKMLVDLLLSLEDLDICFDSWSLTLRVC